MGKTTRVVVCGMKSVGKTSLLEQLAYGNITQKMVSIVNLDQYKK
jgi:NF-kappa-B inhibitor-interacting Ras-like protein